MISGAAESDELGRRGLCQVHKHDGKVFVLISYNFFVWQSLILWSLILFLLDFFSRVSFEVQCNEDALVAGHVVPLHRSGLSHLKKLWVSLGPDGTLYWTPKSIKMYLVFLFAACLLSLILLLIYYIGTNFRNFCCTFYSCFASNKS